MTSRVAYEDVFGQIPAGLFVCHHCDNRICCNPAHLFIGDAKLNAEDMVSKDRSTRGERHGNCKFTDIQIEMMRAASRGGMTGRRIAEVFGASESRVSSILTGKHR